MQGEGFEGINFRLSLRQAIAQGFRRGPGPSESRFVWSAVVQGQR